MRRTLFVLSLLALMAAVVAGCGGSGSSSSSGGSTEAGSGGSTEASSGESAEAGSGGTYEILDVGDFSGESKILGENDLVGIEAVANYINANGGMNGEKVTVSKVDTGGNPQNAVSVFLQYLGSHETPDFVVAGAEGNETGALFPVLARYETLAWAPDDGNALLAKESKAKLPLAFDAQAPTSVPATKVAEYFKELGVKKVGILEEGIAYTEGETPTITPALEEAGLESAVVSFPAESLDVTPEISKLKDQGVEAIYLESLAPATGYALKARTKLGFEVPVLVDLAASSGDLTTLAATNELKGVEELVFRSVPTSTIPGVELAAEEIKKAGGATLPLDVASLLWDAGIATQLAAEQAGSTSAKDIAAALEETSKACEPNLYANYECYEFDEEVHENLGAKPGDYQVIPAGPVVDGQIAVKE